VTIVVSRDAEARAGALRARSERARNWLADQLAAPFSFDLYVLDEGQWAEHAEVPMYATHAQRESGEIVLGAQPCRLIVAAERLWDTRGVEALRALQAGEVAAAAEVERNWP
jgi:hypothetical protein